RIYSTPCSVWDGGMRSKSAIVRSRLAHLRGRKFEGVPRYRSEASSCTGNYFWSNRERRFVCVLTLPPNRLGFGTCPDSQQSCLLYSSAPPPWHLVRHLSHTSRVLSQSLLSETGGLGDFEAISALSQDRCSLRRGAAEIAEQVPFSAKRSCVS